MKDRASLPPVSADKKSVDYHTILEHILEPMRKLMCHPGGIFWQFRTLRGHPKGTIHLCLHSLLGDHEGHDKAACHKSAVKVPFMCRRCNTPRDMMDEPRFSLTSSYKLFSMSDIQSRAGAHKYSFRCLTHFESKKVVVDSVIKSAYNSLPFGDNDGEVGIHLRTQVDALHDRLKGDMETAHESLLAIQMVPTDDRKLGVSKKKKTKTSLQLSMPVDTLEETTASRSIKQQTKTQPKTRYLFCESIKSVCEKATTVWGVCLQHQSDRMLPRTNFTSGALSTEKINAREYVGLILLDLLLLCSTLGDHLFSDSETAIGKESTGYSKRGYLGNERLLQWVDILDAMLLIDGFERTTEISEHNRRLCGKYLIACCERCKKTLDKTDGNGMRKLKFHSKVHRAEQIEDTGVPDNTDAERTEHFQINACKDTAKNTQKESVHARFASWSSVGRKSDHRYKLFGHQASF